MQLERKAILRWVLDHLVWVLLFVVTLFLSFTIKGFAQWGI